MYSIGVFDIVDRKKGTEVVKESTKVPSKKKRGIIKKPATSNEIPKEVPYLLIGGGTASFAAFRAIKSTDPTAKVRYYFVYLLMCFLRLKYFIT